MNGAAEFSAGTTIDRYRIVRTIGRGASGTVYEAIDRRLERPVALKIAAPAETSDAAAERTARFAREGRFAASLSHPNLCPVYDFGVHDNRPYLVMALLPGATLADLIARHAPLAADRIVVLLRPVVEALAELHRVGLVHGDLKPHNILLDSRLEPMLTDFGLARPERFIGRRKPHGAAAATASPAYQAPEQLHSSADSTGPRRGDPLEAAPFTAAPHVGPAADMHAVGVILYVLLTGRLPFAGTAEETIEQILEATPAAPSSVAAGVPRELEQICMRLLRKDPKERPSAVEVARRLRLVAERGGGALGAWPEATATARAAEAARRSEVSEADEDRERGTSNPGRGGPSRSSIAALLMLVALAIVGGAIYAFAPWREFATRLPSLPSLPFPDESESDRDSGATGGSPAEPDGSSDGGAAADRAADRGAIPPRVDRSGEATSTPVAVEEFETELAAAPARLFVDGGRVVVAAAELVAEADGNAVLWWDAGGAVDAGAVAADSLVPLRGGGKIVGVMTSESGETVAILGESWYGRVPIDGGAVVTNPVTGWVTVERAATSPSGRFALLQKTGLENRKRISVWGVVDDANPVELMAGYREPSTTAVALSADGRGLAVGDEHGRVVLQKVAEDAPTIAELEVAGPVTAIAFSTDSRRLAVAFRAAQNESSENESNEGESIEGDADESETGGIAWFHYESGEWRERPVIAVEQANIGHLFWSADGAWLGGLQTPPTRSASAPLPYALLWRADSPTQPQRIPDVAGTAIAFVDRDAVLVGHGDGIVRRWQVPRR